MSSVINYRLRPGKSIDRMLFIELLSLLGKFLPIYTYKYVGFGSYNFDEFRLLNKHIQINDMESIEADPEVHKRSIFNKPLKCIKTQDAPMTSAEYISTYSRNKPTIFWLDYTTTDLREQIDEFCALVATLEPNDIIKITLNAHPPLLGNPKDSKEDIHKFRIKKLQEKIADYLPSALPINCVTPKQYPKTLLCALNNALNISMGYSKKRFYPLISNVYADGQQMLTITGIIQNNEDFISELVRMLKEWNYPLTDWNTYNYIEIPHLTLKELITITEHLEHGNTQGIPAALNYKIDETDTIDAINNFKKYFKYYPNYLQVII